MNKKLLAGAAIAGSAALLAREYWLRSGEASLAGEVVLITGGSRGLGLALAREFAHNGCKVAICAREQVELDAAVLELETRGIDVFGFRCDVTRRDDVELTIAAVTAHFGRIDILVNNAGSVEVGPIEDMRIQDFEDAMNVIFWGTVYPTLAILPTFLGRRTGRIVNISSVGGKVSVPHMLPYASAKFAVSGFSEGLAAELRPKGIRVTAIYPGLMRTGSFMQAMFKGNRRKEAQWFTLGASLPGLSMNTRSAAKEIVTAIKRGETERILSMPARVVSTVHKFFPGGTSELLSVAASTLMPQATGNRVAQSGRMIWKQMHPAVRIAASLGMRAVRNYNQGAV